MCVCVCVGGSGSGCGCGCAHVVCAVFHDQTMFGNGGWCRFAVATCSGFSCSLVHFQRRINLYMCVTHPKTYIQTQVPVYPGETISTYTTSSTTVRGGDMLLLRVCGVERHGGLHAMCV